MTRFNKHNQKQQKRSYILKIIFCSIVLVCCNTFWMERSWSSAKNNEEEVNNNGNNHNNNHSPSSRSSSSCKIKVSETPISKVSTQYYVSPYHQLSTFLEGPGLQHLQNYRQNQQTLLLQKKKYTMMTNNNNNNNTSSSTLLTTTLDDRNNNDNNNDIEMVCRLHNKYTLHFPHVMQQLYACISWWQVVLTSSTTTNHQKKRSSSSSFFATKNSMILSFESKVNTALQTSESNRFTRGILKYLRSEEIFNVTIRIEEDIESKILYYGNNGGDDHDDDERQPKKQSWMVQPILLESMFQGGVGTTITTINNTTATQQQEQQQQAPYNMESPIHMETFVNGIIQKLLPNANLLSSGNNNNDEGRCHNNDDDNNNKLIPPPPPPPRIGILNRHNTRSILNIDELVQRISNEIVLPPTPSPPSTQLNVSVVYFESQPFEDQVKFFANTDILLSPHGAQLTGIPFMFKNNRRSSSSSRSRRRCNNENNDIDGSDEPSRISSTATTNSHHNSRSSTTFLLEFLPKRYWVPEYFGSLANLANIQYNYIYLSNVDDPYEEKKQIQSMTFREQNLRKSIRNKNYCLPLDIVITSIQNMVDTYYDDDSSTLLGQ